MIDLPATAIFLDFDGTLAEIVPHPDGVTVEPEVRRSLARLAARTGNAVALVSGRSIERLDAFLAPLKLPAGGVHGAEIRGPDGLTRTASIDPVVEAAVLDAVRAFAATDAGLLAEPKWGAVALHYRLSPHLEADCLDLAERLAAAHPEIALMRGKMVVELRLGGRTKADAIRLLSAEPPFAGRKPIFVGDDVTDEDGFAEANRMGGFGVKVGAGETAARYRAHDIAAFWRWLARLAGAETDGDAEWSGASARRRDKR